MAGMGSAGADIVMTGGATGAVAVTTIAIARRASTCALVAIDIGATIVVITATGTNSQETVGFKTHGLFFQQKHHCWPRSASRS